MLNKRKRLTFLAGHRGTKEADIMIGRFVEAVLPQLADSDLGALEDFLQIPDAILVDWAYKRDKPLPDEMTVVVEKFLDFYA